MKRGLVLEGGGAKGAYQLGCLIAFEECQIRFDVIAGTSVGALNGALASSHALGKGAEYWKNLSLRHVVAPRWWFLPIAPLLMLYVVSYHYNKRGHPPPLTSGNLVLMLLYVGSLVVVGIIESGFGPAFYYASMMFFLFFVPWLAYSFLRYVQFSIFRPSPLEAFLSETNGMGTNLKIPLYVTLTHRQLGFDPDLPRLFYWKREDTAVWGAVEDEYEFPKYFRIDKCSIYEQKTLLLGSAALPLGIFPPIHMDSIRYDDGGLADNLPLYPLISYEQCDELVVIALRPTSTDSLKNHWQEIDRRMRLHDITIEEGKELYYAELNKRKEDPRHAIYYQPPINLPLRQPEAWPPRMIVISPQRPLGSFLTGTINFRSRYARRLIEQGYRDALVVIENQFPLDFGTERRRGASPLV